MPPKTSAKKGEVVEGEDPSVLLTNYTKYSRLIGLPINPCVVKCLTNEEVPIIDQIIIDEEFNSNGNFPLGPGGTRALMTALLGQAPGMKGGPYKLLRSLRFWRSGVEDEGVNAVCEVLRLGGGDVRLAYLELLDCHLTYRAGIALGTALSYGHNVSLLTLKLDYNRDFGSLGFRNLSIGLRTNRSLHQLHVMFCDLDVDAGAYISDILMSSVSVLEVLNVAGNRLRGRGLKDLCVGLSGNRRLKGLYMGDNMIEEGPEDLDGLAALRDCLLLPSVALVTVDLMFNRIGASGGEVLIPALANNKRIKEFLVDVTIPLPIFDQIFRRGATGKKKGGKKKQAAKKK